MLYDTGGISYNYSGNLVNLKSRAGSNLITKVAKRFSRITKLSYYIRKFNIDQVISFLYQANVVNFFSIGAKKILACRGYGDYLLNSQKYAKMVGNINAFIVQTERMKLDFVNDYNVEASKIKILSTPFDTELIKNMSKEDIETDVQDFINSHKTICTVGSFKKDNGHWNLIKSFVEVKKGY